MSGLFPAFSKSALYRKGRAASLSVVRYAHRRMSHQTEYEFRPPILVNSLPKSGTHLLLQMVPGVPPYRSYGNFVATTPSLTMRRRSDQALSSRLQRLCPGEVCGAHLYYSHDIASAIRTHNIVPIFIYRNPRDVFWSEMRYLLHMNPWHRAGRYARAIKDRDQQFEYFLYGKRRSVAWDFEWPRFSDRVKPYLGWLQDETTFSCPYEDLRNPETRDLTVASIARHMQSRVPALEQYSIHELSRQMIDSIDPLKSHTYRKGGQGEWRNELTMAQQQALESEVEGLFSEYGGVGFGS